MQFKPMSDQEIMEDYAQKYLMREGEYDFEISNAVNKVSKNNNEMIFLTLKVWDENGKEKTINDNLMSLNAARLKQFCKVVGLEDKYDTGEVSAHDCLYKNGVVKIGVEKGGVDQYGETQPDKNKVLRYLLKKTSEVSIQRNYEKPSATHTVKDDEDLPF